MSRTPKSGAKTASSVFGALFAANGADHGLQFCLACASVLFCMRPPTPRIESALRRFDSSLVCWASAVLR
eukprot:6192672-Pleurochrysis_carterae.AAC.4